MKKWSFGILACVAMVGVFTSPLLAAQEQDSAQKRVEEDRARIEAEVAREMERNQARAALRAERERVRDERNRVRAEQEAQRAVVDVEIEMREAEARMARAARRIAELSSRQLPGMSGAGWTARAGGKPVLGVTLSQPGNDGPVEGVEVLGVSPGGAAAEAGLRSGDVITAMNDESLSATSGEEAHQRLIEFMSAVEVGDTIDIEYLRGGKSGSVSVEPRPIGVQVFRFEGPGTQFSFPVPPAPPGAPAAPQVEFDRFMFLSDGHGFGDMEMVKITEGLGRYFGTDTGLLVVRAPQDDRYQLQDGDVILDVDGRAPNSVAHAVRILGSYQQGENLKVRVMRDKREQTLAIDMPKANSVTLFDPTED